MNLSKILIKIDAIRSFLSMNLLVLYVYLQILFIILYCYLDKHSLHLQFRFSTEIAFDTIVFITIIFVSLFVIFICIMMTFLEYILKRKLHINYINISKFSKKNNFIHCIIFYLGLFIQTIFMILLFFKI